jgi:putative glycosyltransferase (TIGR04348 family)
MRIIIITPAATDSRAGNRATAERWKNLLEASGHRVSVGTDYRGEACDAFIALHAWRSRSAIQLFCDAWPGTPLILALTGTDIYHHQHQYPADTHASMAAADVLIGLHSLVAQDIPEKFADKLVTLYQSAQLMETPSVRLQPDTPFDVCVIGHLREEKDSLRTAMAARLLPNESRIRILCAGKAYNEHWQAAATDEMKTNPRFQWLGELNGPDTRHLMAKSQIMVISSLMEGGANVVSEACRAGLPVIASDIPGNLGLLGEDYSGYYPAGDEQALADRLQRAERDAAFLSTLRQQVSQLGPLFSPDNERKSLEQALNKAIQCHASPGGAVSLSR